MPTFEHESHVRAPFEDVWEFYSTLDGLKAVTPGFVNLRVESARGPDGEPNPELLQQGAEADLSVRPFGVGPRQGWTTHIIERRRENGAGLFRDEMRDGPFTRWVHTHSFYADDGRGSSADEPRVRRNAERSEGSGTLVRDRVEYELPFGELGHFAGPFAVVGFEPMFRYRHRETKRRLE